MLRQSLIIKTTAVLLAVVVLFASCSSSTLIQSEPNGAKVYMNGEYKGTTPYSYTDTKIVGSSTQLRVEKEGYETLNTILTRNESADVGAIIGGIFFLFPFLWTMKYNPVHIYELKPLNSAYLNEADQGVMVTDLQGNEYISGVLRN